MRRKDGERMSDTVKLIIEIPKEDIEFIRKASFVEDEKTMFKQSPSDRQGTMMLFRLMDSIKNGTPLDNNSDRSEVQAYFAGEAYGWEEGRKAMIDAVRAEFINSYPKNYMGEPELGGATCHFSLTKVLNILDRTDTAESED